MHSSLATLAFLAGGAHAWGSLGHETVAFIAQNYVSASTQSWAQSILNDTSTSYLASIATWADSYRYTTAGEFSAPFHYIDALDSPPTSCGVDYDRDCTDAGCIVSAIANYTQRVQSPSLSDQEVNYALRWIVHFLGDITQPLHVENYELGGNGVDVKFDGEETNLHASWDSDIPEELVGGYALSDAREWAEELVGKIDDGDYSSQASSWIADLDVEEPIASAMSWANDANAFVCSVVAPDGWDVLEDKELYPDYYNSAIGTVEVQIAKGGYRLAKWLDAVAAEAGARKVRRDMGVVEREVDLSGTDLLPEKKPLTPAQRRRAAVGFGCGHEH